MYQLIDFYADWCGPCKIMSPLIDELKNEYQSKVEFKKVDVETEIDLATQYQIYSIPTFVILKDNKEIDRRSGAMPKEMFKNWLDSKIK